MRPTVSGGQPAGAAQQWAETLERHPRPREMSRQQRHARGIRGESRQERGTFGALRGADDRITARTFVTNPAMNAPPRTRGLRRDLGKDIRGERPAAGPSADEVVPCHRGSLRKVGALSASEGLPTSRIRTLTGHCLPAPIETRWRALERNRCSAAGIHGGVERIRRLGEGA